MKAIKVTLDELANILLNTSLVKGMPIFASLVQATEPKTLKKNRQTKEPAHFENVTKVSKVSIILNSEYEKAVTNQLTKEGKEHSEYKKGKNTMPIEFGECNQFIGKFNGKWVLQYRPNDQNKPRVKYLVDGKLTDVKAIRDFLPAQLTATNQGTDREIFWRKLYLCNLRKLTLNGVTYKIVE